MAKATSSPNPVVEIVTMAACRNLLASLPVDSQRRVLAWLNDTVGTKNPSALVLPDLTTHLRTVMTEALAQGQHNTRRALPQPERTAVKRGKLVASPKKVKRAGPVQSAAPVDTAKLKAFLQKRKPGNNAELVTALAAFLTDAGSTSFRPRELAALNRAAGNAEFTNITVAMTGALNKGWLARTGDGAWQVVPAQHAVASTAATQTPSAPPWPEDRPATPIKTVLRRRVMAQDTAQHGAAGAAGSTSAPAADAGDPGDAGAHR